eukprot:scaffold104219_cov17-Tisochrysis_lutea.AAC.2
MPLSMVPSVCYLQYGAIHTWSFSRHQRLSCLLAAASQAKSKRLKERTIENVGALTLSMGSSSVGGAAISLDQLTAKVAEVYVRCGFDADKSIGTLQASLHRGQLCVVWSVLDQTGKANGKANWESNWQSKLGKQMAHCYICCKSKGHSDPMNLMLTNLESKLEEYLVAVDAMPTEYAENMEKAREKERRKCPSHGPGTSQLCFVS